LLRVKALRLPAVSLALVLEGAAANEQANEQWVMSNEQ
jgi:hypothetical protein